MNLRYEYLFIGLCVFTFAAEAFDCIQKKNVYLLAKFKDYATAHAFEIHVEENRDLKLPRSQWFRSPFCENKAYEMGHIFEGLSKEYPEISCSLQSLRETFDPDESQSIEDQFIRNLSFDHSCDQEKNEKLYQTLIDELIAKTSQAHFYRSGEEPYLLCQKFGAILGDLHEKLSKCVVEKREVKRLDGG